MKYVEPPPWDAGRQGTLNSTGARVPEHTFGKSVPVVVRIVWEHDGEEQFDTVALGWTRAGCVRPCDGSALSPVCYVAGCQ